MHSICDHREGIHLGLMLSSVCILYSGNNVNFKNKSQAVPLYSKRDDPYPLLLSRVLLLKALSSSCFYLIHFLFQVMSLD